MMSEDALLGRSSTLRRKEAVKLGKERDSGPCDLLLKSLKIEQEGKNLWSTKGEIIKSLGLCRCGDCADLLFEKYVTMSDPSVSYPTSMAALSYVRLTRAGLDDIQPVLKVLNLSNYFASEGALNAMGYDRMIPSESDQMTLIKMCWDFGRGRDRGLCDPRYGLAAACAGWAAPIVCSFLEYCLESEDAPLKYVAENSLKKCYVKLR